MAPYLMVSLLCLARLVVAPPPSSDGDSGSDSSCATDGSSATYSETIGSDGDGIATRTIVTTDLLTTIAATSIFVSVILARDALAACILWLG